jgi:hypothetical protein
MDPFWPHSECFVFRAPQVDWLRYCVVDWLPVVPKDHRLTTNRFFVLLLWLVLQCRPISTNHIGHY